MRKKRKKIKPLSYRRSLKNSPLNWKVLPPTLPKIPLITKNSRPIEARSQILGKNEAFSATINTPLKDSPCLSRRRRREALFSKGLIGKVHFAKWTKNSLERC